MSTTEMTPDSPAPQMPAATVTAPAGRGRWIDHWEPEDPDFWESTGKRVANRNLWFSVFAEHIGFSMWTVWS
ncbi:MAG: MFS transporter, partial [Actinobacteria bacterium]|nr:MFS transporter [Actinomycetota bacterium]